MAHVRTETRIRSHASNRHGDNRLSKHGKQWQATRTGETIQRFLFYRRRQSIKFSHHDTSFDCLGMLQTDDRVRIIRLKQLPMNKERT